MIRGVLFDLDDTLFDHQRCARAALAELQQAYASLRDRPFEEVEQTHARLLESIHAQVLTGALPLDVAREERFRRLFEACGDAAAGLFARAAAQRYRDGYQRHRRAIAGAGRLLEAVRGRARVAVVSNNLLAEQRAKLAHCGLDGLIDALIVSEEAGVAKPDPGIFELALARLGVPARQAVMIGDSWHADIDGARAAGIRAVWFNPRGCSPPRTDTAIRQLHALEPVDRAMAQIFDAWSSVDGQHPHPGAPHADGRCA